MALRPPFLCVSAGFPADVLFCFGSTKDTVCDGAPPFDPSVLPRNITLEQAGWTDGLYVFQTPPGLDGDWMTSSAPLIQSLKSHTGDDDLLMGTG